MSGTSMDGVDCALLDTDGDRVFGTGPADTWPMTDAQRDAIRRGIEAAAAGWPPSPAAASAVTAATDAVTRAHADAIAAFADRHGEEGRFDLVGLHGQTILHRPERGITVQIGDAAALAARLRVPVAHDFRSADVAAGGEGAPLLPLYHAALVRGLRPAGDDPVAVLNIGGVANVTWIAGAGEGADIFAFDTGPGNAPIDDWVRSTTGAACDMGGMLAAAGRVDGARIAGALAHPHLTRRPPKSLDRQDFTAALAAGLSPADGAATLTALVAATVAAAQVHFPRPAVRWLVTGGGRHNPVLMAMLADRLEAPVAAVESVGWRGDALEAEGFAFLAARVLRGLPLSLPGTTGVPRPMPGGRLAPVPPG